MIDITDKRGEKHTEQDKKFIENYDKAYNEILVNNIRNHTATNYNMLFEAINEKFFM